MDVCKGIFAQEYKRRSMKAGGICIVLRRILIDFSHGQEKTSSQKEKHWKEETIPEKISRQESAFRQEEDG